MLTNRKGFIIICLLSFSCEDKSFDLCGCSGSEKEAVTDINGIVAVSNGGTVFLTADLGYLLTCESMPNDLEDGDLVSISGILKSNCRVFNFPGVGSRYLNLKNFQKQAQLSLDKFEITIINSEDYNAPVGFGYTISFEGKVKIIQPIIPAVSGAVPFKSKSDAMKIAVLVVNKMKNSYDLPTVLIEELKFLSVIPN